MDSKLTIRLDESIIMQAKLYAKKRNTSLSQLIEGYLGKLVETNDEQEITPLVKSLSGVLKLPVKYDAKKAYKDHVLTKYSK